MFLGKCQEFDDYKDADDAVYEMNHKEFLGERYIVCPSRNLYFVFWRYSMFTVCTEETFP